MNRERPSLLSRDLPPPIIGYPVDQIAEALGIAPRTMRRAVATGRIKTVPISRLITPEEAKRVLAQPRWRGRERTHDPATGRFKGPP